MIARRTVCGELTTETTETIIEHQTREVAPARFETVTTTRTVTVWTYDFGPRRIGERVVLDGGWVREIRETGYGRSR